ncbi:MAG: amidohydrolase family protein [Planctomycetota bacterium]
MTTIGGQLLRISGDSSVEITPGVVTLSGERIAQIDYGPLPESIDFGGPQMLISPGFIDTHVHLPQFDSIGVVGQPLLPWLNEVIFPAEIRWNELEFAKSMTARVIDQLLAHGTTAVCAYATVSHPSTIAAIEAFAEAGFRGVIGQTLIDRHAPRELTRGTEQLIEEVEKTLERFPSTQRMSSAVTPRYALACTPELMTSVAKLAQAHNAIIQTHLAENVDECRLVSEAFDGMRYVDIYETSGLLGPRSLFGHGIYLDASDREKLSRTGSRIAHCPTANSFLASGTMDRNAHLHADLGITLGSDIGAGYERSMVRVGRAMIDAAMRLPDDPNRWPSAGNAWWQITRGNADALGWTDVGRLEVGATGDLLCIEPNVPWLESVDPLAMLLFAWDDRWIKRTMLRGRVVFGNS